MELLNVLIHIAFSPEFLRADKKRNWIFKHGLVQGLLSMMSLLTHNVAHSTRPFFKPKTNNQTSPFFSLKNVILEAHFLLLTFLETFNFQITLFCKIKFNI